MIDIKDGQSSLEVWIEVCARDIDKLQKDIDRQEQARKEICARCITKQENIIERIEKLESFRITIETKLKLWLMIIAFVASVVGPIIVGLILGFVFKN